MEQCKHEHWAVQHDTGKTVYEQCKCGRRRAWQRSVPGFEPLNARWLAGEIWRQQDIYRNPPRDVALLEIMGMTHSIRRSRTLWPRRPRVND